MFSLSGGRTYISLVGLRGLFFSPSLSAPLPASLAAAAAAASRSSSSSSSPLRLEVRGYRGPVDPLPPALGPLRCASVTSGVFVSAYAATEGGPSGAPTSQTEPPPEAPMGPRRCQACRSSCYLGAPCVVNVAYGDAAEGFAGGLSSGAPTEGRGPSAPVVYSQRTHPNRSSSGAVSAASASVCCCCRNRGATSDDPAESGGPAAGSNSDILVATAPDLRAAALLQSHGCNGAPPPTAAAAPTVPQAAGPTDVSALGGYFFPSSRPTTAGGAPGGPGQIQVPRNSSSNNTGGGPSLCNEWYFCIQLREGAGRVLLVSASLASPAFGVLQQSSSICPSPFDERKRAQWLSLPYRGDPFSAFTGERGPGGAHRGPGGPWGGKRQGGTLYSSLPGIYPPCALSDASAGALCGAPKLLVVTSKYVLHLRRQSIAQIYIKAIQNLSLVPCALGGDHHQGYHDIYSSGIQQQEQQQRGMLVSVGPQRQAQWRHACLLAEQMAEETHFGPDAMFAVFWQLMVDSTASLSSFPFSQSLGGGGAQQGGPEGPPATENLLDKQLGALRSHRGTYFQPPGAPQMTQGGPAGGSFGFFETPFGLGYLDDSGRQQQQQTVAGAARAGPGAGSSSMGGQHSVAAAATAKEGDGRAIALAVAWRMLAALEARKETTPSVNLDLPREQLLLPLVLQQPLQQQQTQQQTQQLLVQQQQQSLQHQHIWSGGIMGLHNHPQQQQLQQQPQQPGPQPNGKEASGSAARRLRATRLSL